MSHQVLRRQEPAVCPGTAENSRRTMSLRDTIASMNEKNLSLSAKQPIYSKDDPRYGRPESGSKTEKRGIKAGNYVCREVQFLCEIIDRYAQVDAQGVKTIKFGPLFELYATYSDKFGCVSVAGNFIAHNIYELCEMIDISGQKRRDGTIVIDFGRLFKVYQGINDKVVGMLLRARKYGLVDFDGEMLYQRQDDHKIITMLLPLDEIRRRMKQSGDPKDCIAVK